MRYEFTFTEPVPAPTAAEFPQLSRSGTTTLYGRVVDAAQLNGLLTRFRLLGLDMTDMRRLPD